ncbi:uncharacterized protein LOC136035325 [Artemia franciscana]|uniref:uncharacterized protein LOC136035325 n=1 Tax=Artemia franciscana TaxID=6661 RepID=UPI0032DA2247
MIKTYLGDCITVWMTFFTCIWKSEKVLEEWRKSTLIKLFKKGDASKCDNWRRISLLSILVKLFSQTILCHIQTALDKHWRDKQHGVQIHEGNTWCFGIMSGVKQGCVLSTLLLSLLSIMRSETAQDLASKYAIKND